MHLLVSTTTDVNPRIYQRHHNILEATLEAALSWEQHSGQEDVVSSTSVADQHSDESTAMVTDDLGKESSDQVAREVSASRRMGRRPRHVSSGLQQKQYQKVEYESQDMDDIL